MRKINKDYISVVRNVNRRLQYEKIPIQKSTKILNKLYKMSEDDNYTIEDMDAYAHESPVFKFLALPYELTVGNVELDTPDDMVMHNLVKELKSAKTKVKYLEKAMTLMEECDYRWNVIRITNSLPDILIHSHPGYESTYIDLQLTEDMSVVFESNDLDEEFDGNLCYTIYKNNIPILPYKSVVEFYECSDDILDATKVFDPESSQWDNALRSLTIAVNAILDNHEDFLKTNVIEAGHEMLEKIKLLSLDAEAYYRWIVRNENIAVDYSECDKTLNKLYEKDSINRRLFELSVIGRKMGQAIILAENLQEWGRQGSQYQCLNNVHTDLIHMSKVLIQEVSKALDNLPTEMFSEGYGDTDVVEREKHLIVCGLSSSLEKLRILLSKQDMNSNKNEN